MSLRTITRTLRCTKCIRQSNITVVLCSKPVASHSFPLCRTYATSGGPPKDKRFDLPEEYTEEVFKALANNPPVMQAMHNVIEAFERRGLKLDKEPSVTEMWKIMKDKEIVDALSQLSKTSKSAGIKLDHILKNLPWSNETTKWAQSDAADPSTSDDAIQERMKAIRDILKRPDPVLSNTNSRTINAKPVFEDDTTDRNMNEEDELSLGEIQGDLRGWWKGGEEADFYERLSKFKSKKGDDLMDGDVYDFWIDEWSSKVKQISKLRK